MACLRRLRPPWRGNIGTKSGRAEHPLFRPGLRLRAPQSHFALGRRVHDCACMLCWRKRGGSEQESLKRSGMRASLVLGLCTVETNKTTCSQPLRLSAWEIHLKRSHFRLCGVKLPLLHHLLVGLVRLFFGTMDALFSPLANALGASVDQIKVFGFQHCSSPLSPFLQCSLFGVS